MMKKHYLSLAIIVALTACGGSSTEGDTDPKPNPTPTSPVIEGDSTGIDDGSGIIGGTLSVSDSDSFIVMEDSVNDNGTFSIDSSGNWIFQADETALEISALTAEETLTEEIIVTTNAGVSQKITVTVAGADDTPIIGTGDGFDSASISSDSSEPVLGKLTIDDPDNGQSFFQPQTNTSGTYGTFSITTLGDWLYTLNNTNQISKASSSTSSSTAKEAIEVNDIFTVTSADGTTHNVIITIIGPIKLGDFTGDVIEDTKLTTEGTIAILNNGMEEAFVNQSGSNATIGDFGEFTVTTAGDWNYSLNNEAPEVQALNADATLTETFTVETASGLTETVTLTIFGSDTDIILIPTPAVISGDTTGDVFEDGTLIATGKLTIVDPDENEEAFIAQVNDNVTIGEFGTFTLDAAGNWQYELYNHSPAVQALNLEQKLTDSFTVTTIDSTTKTVTITINGSDEEIITPDPSGNNQYAMITDTSDTDSGLLRYTHDGEAIVKGKLTISFYKESYTLDSDTNEMNAYIGLFGASTVLSNAIADLRIHEGTLEIRNSDALSLGYSDSSIGELYNGLPFTLDEWHTIEFTWDASSTSEMPTVTFSLDGGTPIAFQSPTAEGADFAGVSKLNLKLASSSAIVPNAFFGIDDIKLYEDLPDSGYVLVFEDNFEDYAVDTALDSTTNSSSPYDAKTNEALVSTYNEDVSQPDPVAAIISGDLVGTVIKDTTLNVSGTATIIDPDTDEEAFIAQNIVQTSFGTFVLSTSGLWSYALDINNAHVIALGSVETLTDSITIRSVDGTSSIITITIQGTPEATNNYAAITDTLTDDAGELRYKHDYILEQGKLTVSFYKESNSVDTEGINKGAYIALYGDSTSTNFAVLDLRIKNGIFEVRNNDALLNSLAFTQDTWHDVEVSWDSSSETDVTSIILTIDNETYGPFLSSTTQVGDSEAPLDLTVDGVKVISFKLGDTSAVLPASTFGIDDIKLYSDQEGYTLVFEDDFEEYSVNENLDASPYHSSTSEAIVAQSGSSVGPIDQDGSVILPSETGIELVDWYLSVPTNFQGKTNDKNSDGIYSASADSIDELDLADDYTDADYFYGIEEEDGDTGIVMICPPRGPTTSENTYYTRVELREMLSRGSQSSTSNIDNNWVFSSAPQSTQDDAAGVDGELNVTLAVNHVTTTYGENLTQVKAEDQSKSKEDFDYQVGRVVIGQIHASSDEPIRLYYRKLPSHTKGSIYYYHEPTTGDEVLVNLIGDKDLDDSDPEPADGIALNEKFSYRIKVTDNNLDVTITRDDTTSVVAPTFDMSASGFDTADEWHYFKVGLYHLNNTAADDDFVQATFYEIRNSHTGYSDSEYPLN